MKITLKKMKQLCELLLEGYEYKLEKIIDFPDLYYVRIKPNDQFNVYEEPNFEFASLSNEIASLKELTTKNRKPHLRDIENLGQLFITLSEHIEEESGGLIVLLDKDD